MIQGRALVQERGLICLRLPGGSISHRPAL
jgi:hypothetical protein